MNCGWCGLPLDCDGYCTGDDCGETEEDNAESTPF